MVFLKNLKIKMITKKLKAMQQNRVHNQPPDEVLQKEIALYMKLADIYRSLKNNKKYPCHELIANECLRAAAGLDSSQAQYQLAMNLLEQGKCRDKLEKEGLFTNPSNARQAAFLFEETHAYLTAAENLGHPLAKRMRGLCYVHGFGVDADKDKGFELIVSSIDQENSWDKVTQIFESMGLNKPEFFSELGKHRGKK